MVRKVLLVCGILSSLTGPLRMYMTLSQVTLREKDSSSRVADDPIPESSELGEGARVE